MENIGLIKAFSNAVSGFIADQWKEYYYCDSLDSDVLVKKGEKYLSKNSSNFNGSRNIISNGSIIAVSEGQCMIIVEQGKVTDLCAEPGEYVYNSSEEHNIF